jgi:hypothetical protein
MSSKVRNPAIEPKFCVDFFQPENFTPMLCDVFHLIPANTNARRSSRSKIPKPAFSKQPRAKSPEAFLVFQD